jgi:carbonic anhydrase
MKSLIPGSVLALLLLSPVIAGEEMTPGLTGADALQRLQQGNERFAASKPLRPNQDSVRRQEAARGEARPFAAVLTCSDATMPPEIILDAGLGDLVVLRTPAALANAGEAAALDHAIMSLDLPLLVVLGHPDCRLIGDLAGHMTLSPAMSLVADGVLTAVATARNDHPGLPPASLAAEAARANVWQSIERVFKFSAGIRQRAAQGRLLVVGAFYDPKSGLLEWMGRHPEERTVIKLYDTPAEAE